MWRNLLACCTGFSTSETQEWVQEARSSLMGTHATSFLGSLWETGNLRKGLENSFYLSLTSCWGASFFLGFCQIL